MRINAAQHLHQSRFAGAIFPHQSVNIALADGKIDVVQRFHARKRLRDTAHFQDVFMVLHRSKCAVARIRHASCTRKLSRHELLCDLTGITRALG